MILDKLVEKKDIMTYADARIKLLTRTAVPHIKSLPKNKREIQKAAWHGRIEELLTLKKNIHRLKEISKQK